MKAYDSSEGALRRELEDAEISAILESPKTFTRDPNKVLHFVRRTFYTMTTLRGRMAGLREEVERLQAKKSEAEDPMNRAFEALKALSEEQRAMIVNAQVQERLALAEKSARDAQRAQAGAMSEANRVRFVLAKLAKDSRLGPAGQQVVEEALKALPAVKPAQVVEPAAPDMRLSNQMAQWPSGFAPETKPQQAAAPKRDDDLGSLFE